MGRDNEFRTYKRPEAATVSKSVQEAMNLFNNAGSNLRKHNFKFGFDGAPIVSKETAVANEKNLYEYTKNSSQDNSMRMIQQKQKNRQSNIQWGLKAQAGMSGNNRYTTPGKQEIVVDHMNKTFTNMEQSLRSQIKQNSFTSRSTMPTSNKSHANVPINEALNQSMDFVRKPTPLAQS